MLNLQESLKKSLAKKNLNKLSIGAFVVKKLDSFFESKYEISGYIKNGILFVKVNPIFAKTQIFMKKKDALESINKSLEKFGYEQSIKEIIIKN